MERYLKKICFPKIDKITIEIKEEELKESGSLRFDKVDKLPFYFSTC